MQAWQGRTAREGHFGHFADLDSGADTGAALILHSGEDAIVGSGLHALERSALDPFGFGAG